jgi:alcohol dehydrogenase class IV
MPFEFATATRILFGAGKLQEVPAAAAALGKCALVVTGASADRAEPLLAALKSAGVRCVAFTTAGEPTVDLIREGTTEARRERCEVVIGFGGGSPIDAGKALAAMLTNPGDVLDYLEVVGRGEPLLQPSAPYIAIPTTAGTGSEVTRNAVLASTEHRVKASLRAAGMLPRLAVIDPDLTLDLPRSLTASTGLDALTQLIEPYVSVKANAMTDLFCVEGIRIAATALPAAWENGQDRAAREGMSWASLLGGLSLANAALGAVHGFAAPIGGMFPAPHGAVCAALLPHVMAANIRTGGPSLRRYDEVARLLTSDPHASAKDAVSWISALCRRLEIPPLRAYGISAADIPVLAEKAGKASSMKGNPVTLAATELAEILHEAL